MGLQPELPARPAEPKDAATAAHNDEHRLDVLERQLEQQLEAVRREKKDVEELLGFLERKTQSEAHHGS